MGTYNPTSIIVLDTSDGTTSGTPFRYAVIQGQYTREWTKYFSTQSIAGQARLSYIDNGPGINQYTISLYIASWAPGSVPYQLGITQTWDVQKANLEASFKKLHPHNALVFKDPFGNAPDLDPTTGVFFYKFTETLLDWSTPQTPIIKFDIVCVETPPGVVI